MRWAASSWEPKRGSKNFAVNAPNARAAMAAARKHAPKAGELSVRPYKGERAA
jgi:hypothetical protein